MHGAEPLSLRPAPDWAGAAQLLIDGCAHAEGASDRVELLERLCDALGQQLYPAFLKVLSVVAEHGSGAAQAAVAQALVDALAQGRLPSGRRPAWGAVPGAPGALRGGGEPLGPIEYLCAWQVQADGPPSARQAAFTASLGRLLGLLAHAPLAREAYRARLRMVAQDPISGVLSRDTRAGLQALADGWHDGSGPGAAQAVQAFMQSVDGRRPPPAGGLLLRSA